jgi:hypothetical protein
MKQQPLLTHDQLVDWLIYHVPLQDTAQLSTFSNPGVWDQRPFFVQFISPIHGDKLYRVAATGSTPLEAYQRAASDIERTYSQIHREITDLYWYWTI